MRFALTRSCAAEVARRVLVVLLLALAVLALLDWAAARAQPVAVGGLGESKLPCVSYAPFRREGHTPFNAALIVSPAQIEADLRLLRELTGCVRTYGIDHGLDQVPAIARRLGLRVVLGAWIGSDAAANAAQLDRALELAHEHADVVELLMVGNEVLLRRELSAQALGMVLADAKRRSSVPISYADVWEFWLRHGAALRDHVDVVSVHVLPYWEDEPVAIDHAVAHVQAILALVRKAFQAQPVFLAEAGWPSQGRQRGAAVPGRLEQTRFVRDMLALETRPAAGGLPAFNLIEGFDQPWKRSLEGAMGGHWGLFDAQGVQRVPLAGPVVPDPQARERLWAAGAGTAVALWAWFVARRRPSRDAAARAPQLQLRLWLSVLAAALAGAAIGALAVWQWRELELWSRVPLEWARNGSMAALALAGAVAAAAQLSVRLGQAFDTPAPVRPSLAAVRQGAAGRGAQGLAWLQLGLLFAVAWAALALLFDGRYRSLLWPLLAAAAGLWLALALLGLRFDRSAREERLLAAVCGVAAPWLLLHEGLQNTEALALGGIWLALAWATWWPHRRGPPAVSDCTHASAASSTAGAAMSAE